MKSLFAFLGIVFAAVQTGGAQTEPRIVVDTTLVVIPVTVTDPSNRFVLGLDKEDFSILEDGVPQKITHFSGEDAPLSVGLLIDTSGSMGMKLDTSHQAVTEFLKTMNAQDEAFLIQFSDQAEVVQGFTGDMRAIGNRMTTLQTGGLTALLDAVELGVREMKKAKNPRKALVVVSDGGDNHSRYTATDIKDIVREADTQIFAFGVFEPILFPQLPNEEVSGPRLLAQIADQTGGRAFGASQFSQLPGIAEKIAIELRNQYVLAYSPVNAERDGKYRHVEVKVRQPSGLPALKARWRLGYYAPSQ
jgi:Ca-activated chloride channel family protein